MCQFIFKSFINMFIFNCRITSSYWGGYFSVLAASSNQLTTILCVRVQPGPIVPGKQLWFARMVVTGLCILRNVPAELTERYVSGLKHSYALRMKLILYV